MIYRIEFAPKVEDQIVDLYHYIARESTPEVASKYTEAVLSHCEKLAIFPDRGVRRDDIRPGLRITNYKSRTDIAFYVEGSVVNIIGIFHGGQNYETIFIDDGEDADA